MQASEAYERGRSVLDRVWRRAQSGETVTLPDDISVAIASVMAPGSFVAQKYALPTQVLLKIVVGDADVRRLTDFSSVEGPFSARSFAKETVVALQPVGRRLGGSDDPYVSNPLREERMSDGLLVGKGRLVWQKLFHVLDYLGTDPEAPEHVLLRVLSLVAPCRNRRP